MQVKPDRLQVKPDRRGCGLCHIVSKERDRSLPKLGSNGAKGGGLCHAWLVTIYIRIITIYGRALPCMVPMG